jgi:hypothetical protein
MEYKIKFACEHMLKKVFSFMLCTALMLIYLLATRPLYAQTTWTGNTNSDWNTAANWTSGVPDTTKNVFIPNVANSPAIAAGTLALAKSVTLDTLEALTIAVTGSLTIKRAITTALFNRGTITNNGTITIDSTILIPEMIVNHGSIINNGNITTNGDSSLMTTGNISFHNYGTCINNGTLLIHLNIFRGNYGGYGVINDGTLTNNAMLNISLDYLRNHFSTCLINNKTFLNSTTGFINLTGNANRVIENKQGTFTNAGSILIDNAIDDYFCQSLLNLATFNNTVGAIIRVTRAGTTPEAGLHGFINGAFHIPSTATFNNYGLIHLGSLNYRLGVTNWGYGFESNGINHIATFNNYAGATIISDGHGVLNIGGLDNNSTTKTIFNNDGIINTTRIHNQVIFNNNASGAIICSDLNYNDIVNAFIENITPYCTFNNRGVITAPVTATSQWKYGIFAEQGIFNNLAGGMINIDNSTLAGISVRFDATFNNTSTINIGNISSVGAYGIDNRFTYGVVLNFHNNVGGIININRSNTAGISIGGDFVNAGSINIGSIADVGSYGVENLGSFTNTNGSNLKIDRCTFMGAYNTSGSTFTNGGNITMGSIATLGAYGLQNNGTFHHNAGAILNIDRSTSTGLYPAQGIFHNHGIITIGSIANVGAYGVFAGGTFNNNSGSLLNIDRSTSVGLYTSNGTFNNAGNINLGANASTGSYGIYNGGIFNHTNGSINIDRAVDFGLSNVGGMFNNSASITIVTIISTTQYGLQNSAIFNNNTGGMIKVDRSSQHGIRNIGSGDFTNVGNINVGSVANVGLIGMVNTALFKNNVGSTININRSTDYGLWNYGGGDFTNNATITIGAQAISGISILNQSLFTNNAGSFLGLY